MARLSRGIRQNRGTILLLSQLVLATVMLGTRGIPADARPSATAAAPTVALSSITARTVTGNAEVAPRNVTGDTPPIRRIPRTPSGKTRPGSAQLATVQRNAGGGLVTAQNATLDLGFAADRPLTPSAAGLDVSSVGSPSVAVNGNTVMCTGNWYAAVSTNGGATFQYLDPVHFFSNPNSASCYNQSVLYVPAVDAFIWTLEYEPDHTGQNVIRLAYASTKNVARGVWSYFDFTVTNMDVYGSSLNMPTVAYGTNALYLSVDVFDRADRWTQACVVRIPFSDLRSGTLSGARLLKLSQHSNLALAHGTGSRLYFAAHEDTSTLRIFSWDETATAVQSQTVATASYQNNNYTSVTPDGYAWLSRADDRIHSAVQVGNELWVAWMAGKGGPSNLPHPYVQVARVRLTDLQTVENRAIWNSQYAFAYPALAANASGEVGISLAYGGSTHYPSHAVGFLTGSSVLVSVSEGAYGPNTSGWGDYLSIRTYQPNTRLFAAVGYSLLSGSQRVGAAEPRYVVFGRPDEVGKVKQASVRVVSPNGGEKWPLLSTQTIQWISAGITGNVKIEISRDGGATWEVEGYEQASSGRFTYNVSGPTSSRTLVRISDAANARVNDVSDGSFAIHGLGYDLITVTSPKTGDNWGRPSWKTITWTSTVPAGDVLIELTRDGGRTYELLGKAVVIGKWFLWSVSGPSTNRARVRISLEDNPGVYGESEEFTITANEPIDGRPAAPTNLVAILQGSDRAHLSWTVNSSVETGFRVEMKAGKGNFAEIPNLHLGKGTNQVTITGLSSKTNYSFRICAYNGVGVSEYSNVALAVPDGVVPVSPKKLKARVLSRSEVLLSWLDNSGNETAFEIQISTDRRNYRVLGVTGAGANSAHVYALWPNTKYFFRVRALNSAGYSGYSNVAQGKTKR